MNKKKKVVLGFGFGYESVRMLNYLHKTDLDFTVVTCLGVKDNVDPKVARWFFRMLGRPFKLIKNVEGMKEECVLDGSKWVYKSFTNTVLKEMGDIVFISGRRFLDYKNRFGYDTPDTAPRPVMDNIVFPFWEGKGVRFTRREKKLIGLEDGRRC